MTPSSTLLRVTGGGTSDIGRRQSQQDEFLISQDCFRDGSKASLFAVFDGHGSEGGRVAVWVKERLVERITTLRADLETNAGPTLVRLFAELQATLLEDMTIDTYMSGTTVAMCLVLPTKVINAHIGDSRIITAVSKNDTPGQPSTFSISYESEDHTCHNAEERQRVEKAGARVEATPMPEGTASKPADIPLRIFKGSLPYPGLVVSRAIGDAVVQRFGVVPEPTVKEMHMSDLLLTPSSKVLIVLGTDGCWDGVASQEVIQISSKQLFKSPLQNTASPATGSKLLTAISRQVTAASLKGMDAVCLDDNTTNIVILLDQTQ